MTSSADAHGHGHSHGLTPTAAMRHRGRLVAALALTASLMVVQAIAGALTGSLALLADAGHMLSDSLGLAIALIAVNLAARPATTRWTFGLQRAEVLAALVNGVVLAVIGVSVLVQGIARWSNPGEVHGTGMLVVGAIGLVGNVIALRLLMPGKDESLNLRGAYLEVLGDLLGSVAVVSAAVVIALTGWWRADAVASLLIGVLILPRAFSLLRDVAAVLLEGAPHDVSVATVREHLLAVPGVVAVHDLHAWTITSGVPVLSAHIVVDDGAATVAGACSVLDALQECLHGHFDVEHSTLQIESVTHNRDHPEHGVHT